MTNLLRNKKFKFFIIKFILLYLFFYFGTIAVIGLSARDGFYSPFIHNYFDFISWLKHSLMYGVSAVLKLFGVASTHEPNYTIRMEGNRGVYIAYDCVGYGVFSFWIAFVIVANNLNFLKKAIWIFGGLFLLWFINVVRITLFLYSINRNRTMPFGIDHHTWFNIFAYLAIFVMIYFFDTNARKGDNATGKSNNDPIDIK